MNGNHELSSVGLRLSGLCTRVPRWKFTGGGTPKGPLHLCAPHRVQLQEMVGQSRCLKQTLHSH
eukprot:10750166-Lingulodinium_polyedra.AAC.1